MASAEQNQLLKMLNQIIENNSYQNTEEEIVQYSLGHINKFWARSMKRGILELARQAPNDIDPVGKRVLAELSARYSQA